MTANFTKMHGLGNDFILFDCRNIDATELTLLTKNSVVQKLCDRRFGVGADQVLLLLPSTVGDFKMLIFNADGYEVEMCGNGIRCFAKYVWDNSLSTKEILEIETLAGIIKPQLVDGLIQVDMGRPVLEGKEIPTILEEQIVDYPLKINNMTFNITCVSMGNPHCVIFVDDVDNYPVVEHGPTIETHPMFPNRTNVEFIEVVNENLIKMRVWERGAGETLACGTGACAVYVASSIKGLVAQSAIVSLKGGELLIKWPNKERVFMSGLAVAVYNGSIDIKNINKIS